MESHSNWFEQRKNSHENSNDTQSDVPQQQQKKRKSAAQEETAQVSLSSSGTANQKVSDQLTALMVKILDDQSAANILSQISEVVAQFRCDNSKRDFKFLPREFMDGFCRLIKVDIDQQSLHNMTVFLQAISDGQGYVSTSKLKEFLKRFGPLEYCIQQIRFLTACFAQQWYHGNTSKEEAEYILREAWARRTQNVDTIFLIRDSSAQTPAEFTEGCVYMYAASFIQITDNLIGIQHRRIHQHLPSRRLCTPVLFENEQKGQFRLWQYANLGEYLVKEFPPDKCGAVSSPKYGALLPVDQVIPFKSSYYVVNVTLTMNPNLVYPIERPIQRGSNVISDPFVKGKQDGKKNDWSSDVVNKL